MIKKIFSIIALVTALTVVLAGCSGSGAKNNSSEKNNVTEITSLTFPEGSMGQVLFIGISDIVNKNHESIRIIPQATIGAESLIEFDQNPERRSSIMISGSHLTPYQALSGFEPFSGKIENPPLGLFTYGPGSSVALATTDPNIKSIKDLAGKKVSIGPPGSNSYEVLYPLLEAADIVDEVNLTPAESLGAGINALRDGTIDVAWNSIVLTAGASGPFKELLLQEDEVYWVSFEKELFDKVKEYTPLPILPVSINKGHFTELFETDYEFPQEDTITSMYTPGYFASADIPEDIIYEIVKTVIEHKEELKNYHSSGATMADHMGEFVPKDMMHPGAVRAYEEAGMLGGLPE
ncbi:TAXI family TRAP transporter solute-binding subunit [Bacillus sp. Marseille-P3661]|uniref:TAXI family TRAP transporter solute-binding subunit n=1 Tax=Bacillus sp. Marseille-P3661 TaxID=1936234 RepID=UPI0015E17992|nr:TAXI family TRAP transporter solute-binding subunit [Bacillus sp. Marseille-P3661]